MSKCNLLRPLSYSIPQEQGTDIQYEGGSFYLFSQYADDLTRQNAQGDAYRVVPSKFAAFNIDYSSLDNTKVGEVFQNKFENCCSVFRHSFATDSDNGFFTPEHCANLFWQTMKDLGYEADNEEPNKMLKWIGESDVCGTTIIDGDTFSEIYCFIPGTASPRKYEYDTIEIEPTREYDGDSNYIYGWTAATYPQNTGLRSSVLESDKLNIETVACPAVLKPIDVPYPGDLMDSHAQNINDTVVNVGYDEIETEENYFNINTIAIFYDIVAKDEEGKYHIIYKNIPLGIYFTGPKDEEDTTTLKNAIKKYISHEDIYSQGTSYGLRITTKFSAHPCVNIGDERNPQAEIIYCGHSATEAAAIIDSLRAATDAMMESISNNSSFNTALKNHLAEFRNKNTNIPYIRTIDGADYWFVNGRNTGRKVNLDAEIDPVEIINKILPQIQDIIINILHDIEESIGEIVNKPYIEYIEPGKYTGNGEITEIPQTEDFQDLYGERCVGMFLGCNSLQRIPRLEISNATDMTDMFGDCNSLLSADLSNSMMVERFTNTFRACNSITTIKLDALSAIDFDRCFEDCNNLVNLIIDNLKGGTADNPLYIDLSGTQVSLHSLKHMIDNVQDMTINLNGQPNGYINIKLPATMSQSFDLTNSILLALNNKSVLVTLI